MHGRFSVSAGVLKSTESDGVVHMWGWAALSRDADGHPIVDSQGDHIPASELEKAAQDAFLRRGGSGAVGEMHTSYQRADLVESLVLTREKQEAFGLAPAPEGWIVGLRSDDPEIVKAVRGGTLGELSIRGTGQRRTVEYGDLTSDTSLVKRDNGQPGETAPGRRGVATIIEQLQLSDVELLSLVDKGASGDERTRPRIVLIKRRGENMAEVAKARTPQVILAELFESGKLKGLPPEDKEVLLTATSGGVMAPPAPAPEPEAPVEMAVEEEKAEEPAPAEKMDDEEEMKKGQVVDLAKRNVELEKRVHSLEAKLAHTELVEVVKKDMAYLPGASVEDLAKVLHEVRRDLSAKTAERVEGLLRASSEAVKKGGLLDAVGVRAEGGSTKGNALVELAKSIKEKRPNLSQSEAILEAGRERPDLWAAHRRKGD